MAHENRCDIRNGFYAQHNHNRELHDRRFNGVKKSGLRPRPPRPENGKHKQPQEHEKAQRKSSDPPRKNRATLGAEAAQDRH